MKLKKLMSAVVATAMAASMVVSVSAYDIYSSTGEWESNNEMLTNASTEFAGINFGTLGLTEVVFHANCTDLNWGWNNGQFNSNSNNGGWQQVSFGGTKANSEVVLESTGAFDVTVPVEPNDGGWFNLGYGTGCREGAFSIESIDFYAGTTLLGTWDDGVYTEAGASAIRPNKVYVQKTAVVDGKYSERAIKMITEAEAQAASKVSVVFNNGIKNSAPVVSTQYYKTITVAGEPITADDGYVFVAAVVKNIPESIDLTATITVE